MATILYTWVSNNTRGSLWPVLLFHTSQAVADVPWLSLFVEAVLVVAVVLIYGPARLARRPALETETA